MINLTLITAELSAKTVYFFQSCGADMGISPSDVLNRLLLKIPEVTPRAAIERTMWYFDALTARKSMEEKLAIWETLIKQQTDVLRHIAENFYNVPFCILNYFHIGASTANVYTHLRIFILDTSQTPYEIIFTITQQILTLY